MLAAGISAACGGAGGGLLGGDAGEAQDRIDGAGDPGPGATGGQTGVRGTGGAEATGGRSGDGGSAGGTQGSQGSGGRPGMGVTGTGGQSGGTGAGGTGGRVAGVGTGGRATASGGAGGAGATTGVGGVPGMGGSPPPLDCGPNGVVINNAGPPKNRLNYVIVGDGYTTSSVNTTYLDHIARMTSKLWSDPIGQPFLRYKNFINICAVKAVSASEGIGNGPTAFSCTGDDTSRLAMCNTRAADDALSQNLPASFEVDWHAIVLNNSRWWNTGSPWMLWSGGHADGPGAALHEGGHGFNWLEDEYSSSCTGASCGSNTMGTGAAGSGSAQPNCAGNPMTTDGKWSAWIGFRQQYTDPMGALRDATGLQGTWSGCGFGSGNYRPSANSMMNSLFGTNPNTSFNAISREQIVFTIWRGPATPIDWAEPPAGAVTSPAILRVGVIDPAVINVDWSVDGAVVAENGGVTFEPLARGLTPGTHTVTATAYDNASTDLVRNRSGVCPPSVTGRYCHHPAWNRSRGTVTWTVTMP